jgi:hypothetical protein
MAVDEVVTTRRNLGEDHRTRQVRCDHGRLVQPLTLASVRNVVQSDELDRESSRSADVDQQPGDVEFENPVGYTSSPSHGADGVKGRSRWSRIAAGSVQGRLAIEASDIDRPHCGASRDENVRIINELTAICFYIPQSVFLWDIWLS